TPLATEREKEATLTLAGWNLKVKMAPLGKAEGSFGIAQPFAVARAPHPCFDLTSPADKPLSLPFTATGYLRKENVPAVIPVTVEAGKAVAVRLDSTTLGLSLTPVLKVMDA